jgi:hypothetical protein
MAGFFQNLRVVSERNAMDAPASSAYDTSTNTNVTQSGTEQIITEGTQSNTLTIQAIPQGFGAYLDGILPPDIAKAAGSFSVTMQQIKNISSVPIEKFAQVVNSLETTKGLNINGTSVPVDSSLAQQGLSLLALGSGPAGTYTMSDFMGCMTGLPYIGLDIKGVIQQIETTNLYNIYKQLYLAVTWEQATATWNGSSFTYTNRGGGYPSAPSVTVSGNPATATIGTNSEDITTYGRIISISYTGAAGAVVIDPPPGGGWPTMNTVVQGYIDNANTEIALIQTNNTTRANQLNNDWAKSGTQLSIEQRAIATGLQVQVPLADPLDKLTDLAQFPTTQIAFVDSIPQFALDTKPHMIAQSLEAISNLCTPGGESLVGLMRESRNKNRLAAAGIPLDNNIPATLPPTENKELIANGSVLGSSPAKLEQVDCPTGDNISPVAAGYYNPTDDRYYSDGAALDIGEAVEPGSFAGSRYSNLIPPELSVIYTSDILLPSTYSVQEAIDEVIRCNCDCWDNI